MNKSITLNLTFRNYNKVKNSTQNHTLILLLLPHKRQSKTHLQIPPYHWDKQKQIVKPRFRNQHKNLINEINIIKDRCIKYPRMILEGDIHPNNVIPEILGGKDIATSEITVMDFIKENPHPFKDSSEKHLFRIGGVHKHLKIFQPDFGTLTVSKLNDNRNIDTIAGVLNKAKLRKTTISGYMQTLDRVTELANIKNLRPFKARKLFPTNPTPKVQHKVELENMVEGFKSIKTYKDIEAYLMFLYSYCLQGLDAVDLANIDENAIHNYNGKHITHYYPFGDYIESKGDINLNTKHHIRGEIGRSKTSGSIDCMVNLFPTLFIRDWLVYLMNITSPEIAYRGKDRLRLWKHKTRTKEGKKLEGNHKLIRVYMGTLSRKMQKLFGGSMKNSRQTVTQVGKMYLGLTEGQLKMQLNHKLNDVIDNYAQGENALEIRDVRHNQLLNYMEITKIVMSLFNTSNKLMKEGKLFFDRSIKAKSGMHPTPAKLINNDMLIGWALMKHNISSKWNFDLEKEWNMIKIQNSNPRIEIGVDGFPKMITANEDEYPERFHELNKIRKDAFGDFKTVITKGGGIGLSEKTIAEILQEENNLNKVKEIIGNE